MTTDVPETREATHHVVFAAIDTGSTAGAVAQRLRTAIGLGLLADGERLPREFDLADQFGVTAFSLREALSTLRAQGLLETKRGRNGGSFVRRPTGLFHSVAVEELSRLSVAALRDISDWGWTLLSATAHHGALRASASNVQRLHGYARRLAAAEQPEADANANSRFHLELAAATQSVRLSTAQIAFQSDFGWMHALLLEQVPDRDRTAASLGTLADAVERRDARAAREVAEQSAETSMHQLIQLRLQLVESRTGASK